MKEADCKEEAMGVCAYSQEEKYRETENDRLPVMQAQKLFFLPFLWNISSFEISHSAEV